MTFTGLHIDEASEVRVLQDEERGRVTIEFDHDYVMISPRQALALEKQLVQLRADRINRMAREDAEADASPSPALTPSVAV